MADILLTYPSNAEDKRKWHRSNVCRLYEGGYTVRVVLRMLDVLFHYSLIFDFFYYSLIYNYFGKMNDLKCLLKLPAEFMKKGFSILTIFLMLHT